MNTYKIDTNYQVSEVKKGSRVRLYTVAGGRASDKPQAVHRATVEILNTDTKRLYCMEIDDTGEELETVYVQ